MNNRALRRESVETASGPFVVETPMGASLTRGWRQELAAAASANPDCIAFVWDDFLLDTSKAWRAQLHRLRWPDPEALLLGQVDAAGRCALKQNVTGAAYGTGAVLAAIASAVPERVGFLPNVLRFAGPLDSRLYAPINPPPSPPHKAEGVSIIINYRDRPDITRACLESIAKQRFAAAIEVILVNNQSSAGSLGEVKTAASTILESCATIRHLCYDASYNHSAQNNIAADAASHEVLLLLNNDATFLGADCAQTISNWALSEDVIAASPRMVGKNGRLVSSGVVIRPAEENRSATIQENETPPLSHILRTSSGAPFSCAAVSRSAWRRLGGLDAVLFPTQYNDADFWLRGLARGMHCIYVGHASVQHEPGQSEGRTKEMTAARLSQLREHHPGLGKHTGRDPYFVARNGVPQFESLRVNAILTGVRAWDRARRAIHNATAARQG